MAENIKSTKTIIETKDNFSLVGIFNQVEDLEKAIILAHGMTVDKDDEGIFVRAEPKLNKFGFTTFCNTRWLTFFEPYRQAKLASGAEEGSRTLTPLRGRDFKSRASTGSATSAPLHTNSTFCTLLLSKADVTMSQSELSRLLTKTASKELLGSECEVN